MKLCNSNIRTNTLTFINIENVIRLVLFIVLLTAENLTGGFFIFLFVVTGRGIIFICSTVPLNL